MIAASALPSSRLKAFEGQKLSRPSSLGFPCISLSYTQKRTSRDQNISLPHPKDNPTGGPGKVVTCRIRREYFEGQGQVLSVSPP